MNRLARSALLAPALSTTLAACGDIASPPLDASDFPDIHFDDSPIPTDSAFPGCPTALKCNQTEVCDEARGECVPFDDCPDSGVCPTYRRDVRDTLAFQCVDGRCRAQPAPPRLVRPIGGAQSIDIVTPARWSALPPGGELVFRWSPVSGSLFALVLRRPVEGRDQLASAAIWGAALPSGATSVPWHAGVPIVDGVWGAASPGDPPTDATLYFVVFTQSGRQLLADSALVPFRVGAPWPAVGAACPRSEGGQVSVADSGAGRPSACFHPSIPMMCHALRCWRLCGSRDDCADGLRCLPPDTMDRARFCELPDGGT